MATPFLVLVSEGVALFNCGYCEDMRSLVYQHLLLHRVASKSIVNIVYSPCRNALSADFGSAINKQRASNAKSRLGKHSLWEIVS
jgi:hypothetical protein